MGQFVGSVMERNPNFRSAGKVLDSLQWLENIETLRPRFPSDAVFHIGHGGPSSSADWDWQKRYIETFVAAVRGADWSSPEQAHLAAVAEMKRFLPTDELQFLMELSIEPVATQLGLVRSAA